MSADASERFKLAIKMYSKIQTPYEEVVSGRGRINDARSSPLIDAVFQSIEDDAEYQSLFGKLKEFGTSTTAGAVEIVTHIFNKVRNTITSKLNNLLRSVKDSIYQRLSQFSGQTVMILAVIAVLLLAFATGMLIDFLPVFAFVLTPMFLPEWASLLTVPLSVCIVALKRWKDKISISTNVNIVNPTVSTSAHVIDAQYQAPDADPITAIANFSMKALVVLFSISSVSLIPSSKAFDLITKRLKDIPSAIEGAGKLTTMLESAFERAKKFYYVDILGAEGYIGLSGETKEIDDWTKDVMFYLDLYNRKEMTATPDTAQKVSDLYLQALRLQRTYAGVPHIMRLITPLYGACLSLYTEVTQNTIINPGPRQEPALIFFGGNTGVGKSGFMYPFAIDALRAMGIPTSNKRYENSIYTRCVEQEYWDGYRGQPICLYDDFGQQRDSMGNPNLEYMELIRGGNLFPWSLHMAHLQDKATTQMKAKAIFCTTNLTSFMCESLINTNAIIRRCDLGYWCSVKREYQRNPDGHSEIDRSLDPLKVPNEFSLDVYEFVEWDMVTGKQGTEKKSYSQVSKEIAYKIRQKTFRHEQRKEFYDAYADEEFEDAAEYQGPANYEDIPPILWNNSKSYLKREFVWGNESNPMFDVWCARRMKTYEQDKVRAYFDLLPFRDFDFDAHGLDSHQSYVLGSRATSWYLDQVDEILPQLDPIQQRDLVNWRKIWNARWSEDLWPYLLCAHDNVCDDPKCVVCYHGYLFRANKWHYWSSPTIQDGEKAYFQDKTFFWQCFSYVKPIRECRTWIHPINHLHPWLHESDNLWEDEANARLFHSQGCACPRCTQVSMCDKGALTLGQWMWMREHMSFPSPCLGIQDEDDEAWCLTAHYQALEDDDQQPSRHENVMRWFSNERPWVEPNDIVWYEAHPPTIGAPIQILMGPQRVRFQRLVDFVHRSKVVIKRNWLKVRDTVCDMQQVIEWIGVLFGITTLGFIGYATFKWFNPDDHQRLEIGASGDQKTQQTRQRLEIGLSGDTKTRAQVRQRLEGVSSEAALQLGHIVQKNQLYLMAQLPNREVPVGQIVGIKGSYFLINLHFVNRLKNLKVEGCQEVFGVPLFNDAGYRIPIDYLLDVTPISRFGNTTDVGLGKMPRQIPRFRNIHKHFVHKDELHKIENIPVNLHTSFISGKKNLPQTKSGTLYGTRTIRIPETGKRYVDSYQCDFDTCLGDCGGLLIAAHDGINRKIIGLHFAGNDGSRGAFSSPLVWEDFEAVMVPDVVEDVILPPEVDETVCADLQAPEGLFPRQGRLPKPVSAQIKSTLVESLIFNQVAPTTMAPAILAPPLEEDGPMLRALKKNGTPSVPIDPFILEDCMNSYAVKMFEGSGVHTRQNHRRVFSFDEAVKGLDLDEFVGGINRVKSPGYPYINEVKAPYKGKQQWFGRDEWTLGESTHQIRVDVRNLIERAAEGIVEQVLYTDHQKDEKRDIETKIKHKKTRSFAGAPMHFVIAFRMYFLDFLSFMMHNRIENESAVGINAYSTQWHRLAKKLQEKGDRVVAGDFSNFDGSLNADMLYACLDLINAFYDDGNDRIRACLWENIVHSVHILHDNVYQWTHCQPSGNPATAILNSMYNSIACRYAFVLATQKPASEFNNHVSMIAYGDDNVLNISEEILESFNQTTMTQAFHEFGMTYTDESKSTEAAPSRTLEEVAFLKRRFSWREQLQKYIAPLSMTSILEMTNWNRKSTNLVDSTRNGVECAIRELYLHDESIFNALSGRMQKILMDNGLKPVECLSWRSAQDFLIRGEVDKLFPQDSEWI